MPANEQVICVHSHHIKSLFDVCHSTYKNLTATHPDGPCRDFLPADFTPLAQIANLITVGRFVNSRLVNDPMFLPRSEAETNETFKHLITYTIITHDDRDRHPDSDCMIFSYRRSPKGGEGRLHGLRSIGVGGHITKEDVKEGRSWTENIIMAAFREINEEVGRELSYAKQGTLPGFRYVGAISDDSNPVGRVHLGLVFELNLTNQVIPREDHLTNHEYQRINDVVGEDYEPWSSLLLKHVMRGPRPTFF